MNINFRGQFWSQIQFLSRGCIVCKLTLPILFLHINEAKGQDNYFPEKIGESLNPNININESQGAFSQNLKRSIGWFVNEDNDQKKSYCSCNLVNTVTQNKIPYVLTAAHCLKQKAMGERHEAYFSFDYEMPDHDDGEGGFDEHISGVWKVNYQILFKNEDTDIALLKFENPPSELLENAYAGGWDNSLYSTVYQNISHPKGDHKKIFVNPSQSFIKREVGNIITGELKNKRDGIFHIIRSPWSDLENSNTEAGSSGAGGFSNNHHLIGINSGGAVLEGPPYKFFRAYSSLLNNWKAPHTAEDLATYLDPNESFLNQIPGGYLNDLVSMNENSFSLTVQPKHVEKPPLQTPYLNPQDFTKLHKNIRHLSASLYFPIKKSPSYLKDWFEIEGIKAEELSDQNVVLSVWYPDKSTSSKEYTLRLFYGSYINNQSTEKQYGFASDYWNCNNPPEGFPDCNRIPSGLWPFRSSGRSRVVQNRVIRILKKLANNHKKISSFLHDKFPIVVQLDNIGNRAAKINAISYPGEGPLNALQLFQPEALKDVFNYYKYKESRGVGADNNYFIRNIKLEFEQFKKVGGVCKPLAKKTLKEISTDNNGGYLNLVNHLQRISNIIASDPACPNQKNKLIITIVTGNDKNKHYGAWLDYDRYRIGGGQLNPDDNYTYDFKIIPPDNLPSEQLEVSSTKEIAIRIEHEIPYENKLTFNENNILKTRLRVAIAQNPAQGEAQLTPDGIYDFGEVEDYLIEIRKTSDAEKAEARREAIFDKISVANGKQLPDDQDQSGNNDQKLPDSGGSSTAFGGADDAPVQNNLPLVSFSDNPDLQSFLVIDSDVVQVGVNALWFDGFINMLIGGPTGGGVGGYDPHTAKSTVSHYYELIPDLEPVCEDPSVCGLSNRSGTNNASNSNTYQIVIDEGGGENGFSFRYNSTETVYGVKIDDILETCKGPSIKNKERAKILHSFDRGVMKLTVGGETVTNDNHKKAGNLTMLENREGASIGGVSGDGTIWDDDSENINMHAILDYGGTTYKVLNDEEIADLGVSGTLTNIHHAKQSIDNFPISKEEVETEDVNFSIFPNPAKTELNILVEVQQAGSLYIGIYDLSGKRVYETKEPHINEGHQLITLRNLKFSAGQYVLKIRAGDVTKSEQVVFE